VARLSLDQLQQQRLRPIGHGHAESKFVCQQFAVDFEGCGIGLAVQQRVRVLEMEAAEEILDEFDHVRSAHVAMQFLDTSLLVRQMGTRGGRQGRRTATRRAIQLRGLLLVQRKEDMLTQFGLRRGKAVEQTDSTHQLLSCPLLVALRCAPCAALAPPRI
jgi:hypothetical protein